MGASKSEKKGKGRKDKPARRKIDVEKVVRDSFTMPRAEHARIAALKHRALEQGVAVKKSELLRAGIQMLDALGDRELRGALSRLAPVKTGRPRSKKD